MTSNKKAFTLVELLVVIGILAILMTAMGVSVSGAQERARIQKATSDVKVISQAILAFENYDRGRGDFELPTLDDVPADESSLGFLLGEGESAKSGGQIPVLLMASLRSGKGILDPWGKPYRVKIKEAAFTPKFKTATGNLQTGYYMPNFYRLSKEER